MGKVLVLLGTTASEEVAWRSRGVGDVSLAETGEEELALFLLGCLRGLFGVQLCATELAACAVGPVSYCTDLMPSRLPHTVADPLPDVQRVLPIELSPCLFRRPSLNSGPHLQQGRRLLVGGDQGLPLAASSCRVCPA